MPVISGHTGLDIAHALLEALKHHSLVVKDIKQQLVDGATVDGQYFMLHVLTHLLMLIGLHDSPGYKFNWDPARCIELAEGDAQNSSQWISGLCDLISTGNKKMG